MGTFILKNAYLAQPGITDTDLYTCPANTQAMVKKCTACNDTSTATTMTFNKIPAAGSAAVTNLVINARPLGPYETYECPEIVGKILTAGQKLSGKMGAADQVTVDLDVIEIV